MNMTISTKMMSTNFVPTVVEDAKADTIQCSGESSSLFRKTCSVIIRFMFKCFTNLPVLRSIIFMTYDLSYVEK